MLGGKEGVDLQTHTSSIFACNTTLLFFWGEFSTLKARGSRFDFYLSGPFFYENRKQCLRFISLPCIAFKNIYVHIHVHIRTYMYTYVHTYMYTYVHVHIRTSTHNVHIHVHTVGVKKKFLHSIRTTGARLKKRAANGE